MKGDVNVLVEFGPLVYLELHEDYSEPGQASVS